MQFTIPFINKTVSIGAQKNSYEATGVSLGEFFGNFGVKRRDGLNAFKVNSSSLFAVYRMSSDIRNCVRELQSNTGKAGFEVVSAQENEQEEESARALFNYEGSTHQTATQLFSRLVRDLEVSGNAYWVILKNDKGEVLGFQPADPRTIGIVADDTGIIRMYLQQIPGKNPKEYPAEDIIHFKGEDDPVYSVFGLGNLEPIIWEARTDNSAMLSNFNFFKNNAIPSALYILDEKIPTDTIRAKMGEIKKHFGGAKNYKKAGAIVGVKDVKMLNMSHKDMDFLAGRKFSTDKICAAFGVPKFLLGYTETVNNNNGQELKINFIQDRIVPLENRIAQTLNNFFKPYFIEFKFNEHQFTTEKELEERAIALKKEGALTLREARKMMNKPLDEENKDDNVDKFIIHSGASAVLLEDVGIDVELDETEE